MKFFALVTVSAALAGLPVLALAQSPAPKPMATHHAMSGSMSHSMAHATPKPMHSPMSHNSMMSSSHDNSMMTTHASPKP